MVEKLSKRAHQADSSDDEQAIKAARQAAIRERQNRKKRKVQASAADDFEVVAEGEEPKKTPVEQPEIDEVSEKPGKAVAKSKKKKQKGKQKPVEGEDKDGKEGKPEPKKSEPKVDPAKNEGLADVFKKLLSAGGADTEEAPILIKDRRQEKKLEEEKEIAKTKRLAAAERREEEDKGHVIPDVSTKNYERGLSKIATSGVVKLFNAVRKQQKQLEGELENVTLEAKKEKVTSQVLTKGSFLELLKKTPTPAVGGSGATASFKFDIGGRSEDGETKAKGSWLKSDYMMGAKMKDWDKEGGDDGEEEEEEDDDEDEMEFDDDDE